jgi:CRP-like cAMP-binding protein
MMMSISIVGLPFFDESRIGSTERIDRTTVETSVWSLVCFGNTVHNGSFQEAALRPNNVRKLPVYIGKLDFAYFPNRGLISLVVVMKDGKTAEAGIVGNEGLTGTSAAVGLKSSPLQAVVQITGDGFRVEVEALQDTLESAPRLQLMLSSYAAVRSMQVAQTAACNRLHEIEQRLARWLLMTQDRVDSGLLPITHDFLATMLGTDRPTVSLAAGVLQKKKLIEYTRGAVKIVNRKKLEDSTCECYGVIRRYDNEFGLK